MREARLCPAVVSLPLSPRERWWSLCTSSSWRSLPPGTWWAVSWSCRPLGCRRGLLHNPRASDCRLWRTLWNQAELEELVPVWPEKREERFENTVSETLNLESQDVPWRDSSGSPTAAWYSSGLRWIYRQTRGGFSQRASQLELKKEQRRWRMHRRRSDPENSTVKPLQRCRGAMERLWCVVVHLCVFIYLIITPFVMRGWKAYLAQLWWSCVSIPRSSTEGIAHGNTASKALNLHTDQSHRCCSQNSVCCLNANSSHSASVRMKNKWLNNEPAAETATRCWSTWFSSASITLLTLLLVFWGGGIKGVILAGPSVFLLTAYTFELWVEGKRRQLSNRLIEARKKTLISVLT